MNKSIDGIGEGVKPGMTAEIPEMIDGGYLMGDHYSTIHVYDSTTMCGSIPDEHTCGVIDDREAGALVHQILAEIRKSNAPAWVAEELEKKLECQRCSLRTMVSATDRDRPAHLELFSGHEDGMTASDGVHRESPWVHER